MDLCAHQKISSKKLCIVYYYYCYYIQTIFSAIFSVLTPRCLVFLPLRISYFYLAIFQKNLSQPQEAGGKKIHSVFSLDISRNIIISCIIMGIKYYRIICSRKPHHIYIIFVNKTRFPPSPFYF